MERNIKLGYYITFCRFTWFWLGIWVFYYLRYTDYAGIGLIETSLIVAMTISEIPTGAIADLIGKKRSLLIAFILQAIGIGMLAFVPSLVTMIIGVFIAGVGGSFYSGTFEALLYDSLKQVHNEKKYDKVIGHIGTISLLAPAICGIIGGYLYTMWPPFPTALSSLGYLAGFIFCLFLIEPKIDSEKVTIARLVQQTKEGLSELFKSTAIIRQTILFLSIGFIIVIADEMLNSFLGVELGFKEKELGFLWSAIYLISAGASQLTSLIAKHFPKNATMITIGCLTGGAFIGTAFVGKYLGGLLLLLLACLQVVFLNFVSIGINEVTQSRYRATTLSVFNMLKNIPYVLSAYFIGKLADIYSAKTIALWMGICLLVFMLLQTFATQKKLHSFK